MPGDPRRRPRLRPLRRRHVARRSRARRYKAIVLPGVRFVPEATRRSSRSTPRRRHGARGAPQARRRWPSLEVVAEADLTSRLAAAVAAGRDARARRCPTIGFVHRRLADADVYFLANTGNVPRSVTARFRVRDAARRGVGRLHGRGRARRGRGRRGRARLRALRRRGSSCSGKQAGAAPAPARRVRRRRPRSCARGGACSYGGSGARRDASSCRTPGRTTPRGAPFLGHRELRRDVDVAGGVPRARRARVPRLRGGAGRPSASALPGGTLRGNSFAGPRRAAGARGGDRLRQRPAGRVGVGAALPRRGHGLLRDGANEIRIDVYNTAINRLAEGGHLPDMAALAGALRASASGCRTWTDLQPLPSGILSPPRLVLER